jgi:hypothetical protein
MANAKTYTKDIWVNGKNVREKFNIGDHVYDNQLTGNSEPYRDNWMRGTIVSFWRGGAGGTKVKIKIDDDFEFPRREDSFNARGLHHFPQELSEKDRKKFGYYEEK